MVKKCIYCSVEVDSGSVVDMCQRCMYQVWGEKMTKAIVEGMERERNVGNLNLGQVSENGAMICESEKFVCEEISKCLDASSEIREPLQNVEVDHVNSEELVTDCIAEIENLELNVDRI